MDCPKYGGSHYYNYKSFHSIVLMAMCDADYKFTYADIGHYGKDNDASIFSQSSVYQMFANNELPLPQPKDLGDNLIPYYIVGDDIFPLKPWLMKPYAQRNLEQDQRVFNYRLSRARRTIENAFGILAARWRIFHRSIRGDVDTVDAIVKATVCLHNYLLCTDNAHYTPTGFVDSYNGCSIREGDWRSEVARDRDPALTRPGQLGGHNYNFDAKLIRDNICKYVNSSAGSVEWQLELINSVGPA